MFMNISMYNHWNKIILLDTELQAEPQWKSTISAAMQYQIQRIATDKDGIAQIQNASLCMCEDRCDSPGYQDRGEHFKHLLHLHKRWRSLRQGTFFLPNQNELQRTTPSLVILPRILIRCVSPKKSRQCDLGSVIYQELLCHFQIICTDNLGQGRSYFDDRIFSANHFSH